MHTNIKKFEKVHEVACNVKLQTSDYKWTCYLAFVSFAEYTRGKITASTSTLFSSTIRFAMLVFLLVLTKQVYSISRLYAHPVKRECDINPIIVTVYFSSGAYINPRLYSASGLTSGLTLRWWMMLGMMRTLMSHRARYLLVFGQLQYIFGRFCGRVKLAYFNSILSSYRY